LLFIPLWLYLGFNSVFAIIYVFGGHLYLWANAKVIHVHDDGRIVWDEFAGQSITLPLLYLQQMNWLWVIVGFVYSVYLTSGNHFRLVGLTKKLLVAWDYA
jgi:phosphatidylglycerophosphatase A